ncbi:amidohydrolase [Diplodia corticola]|uniref:Amidohydrolase n=1 Tax=Diplodia corticola TaxID=236234 RepID=A0A1J9SL28_9PEZI|nr:amidohydrolase [Diplodia corticola]OJD40325.1 amidohydrolase [Diplodia corticola]
MASSSQDFVKPWRLPAQKTYIFTNANVIDPVGGTLLPDATVKISGGLIESVSSDTALSGAEDATTVDLAGRYICPGLIDAHVHVVAAPGEADLAGCVAMDAAVSMTRQPFVAKQMLARGFTTARDCGGAGLALKQAIADGVFPGPRLFIANHALSQTGGHADFRGAHDHTQCCGGHVTGLGVLCDGVPECIKAAREQLRTGADFIKIMCGGGVASPTDALEHTQFTADEVRAVAEVARGYNTWVTAHAYTPRAIRHAVDNGVTGIEHGNFIDEATAEYMAERGVYLTPTLIAYDAMARRKGFLPPESHVKNEEVLAQGLQALEIASKAGVTMCYGSDLLGPLGMEQAGEFGLRAKVLSAGQVLQSATVNAAKMLRQDGFLGQVKAGFAADMLVLNANPLDDIQVLDRPAKHLLAVIKDGRVYSSRWSKLAEDVTVDEALIE